MRFHKAAADFGERLFRQARNETPATSADPLSQLKGEDRIGLAGRVLTAASGAVGGGFVGAGLGASSIYLGPVVLTMASPVGWVIGGVAVGVLGGYALGKAVQSGGRSDQIREDMRNREELRRRKQSEAKRPAFAESNLADLKALMAEGLAQDVLRQPVVDRILAAVQAGKMTSAVAVERVRQLIAERVPP